jgi:hypothetical protein
VKAQDTPLSDILIDGQGWRPVDQLYFTRLKLAHLQRFGS